MKKNKLLLMCAALLLCALAAAAGKTADAYAAADDGYISATGYGYVNVKPDVAYITIGVRTSAGAAEACYAQNTEKINRIIAAIEKTGVTAEYIQNTSHTLYQEYDHNKANPPVYTATNTLKVKVKDMDILADIYAGAIGAGANSDCGLQFALEKDKDAACAEALGKAMENARAKAEVLARSAGITLGNAHIIIETPSYTNQEDCAYGNISGAALKNSLRETVRAGEIKIDARVTVKYTC